MGYCEQAKNAKTLDTIKIFVTEGCRYCKKSDDSDSGLENPAWSSYILLLLPFNGLAERTRDRVREVKIEQVAHLTVVGLALKAKAFNNGMSDISTRAIRKQNTTFHSILQHFL